MKKVWMIGLTAVALSFFGMSQATAATLCVEPTGAMGCFNTVQGAVGAANPGDHIWVAPGVYYENVVVTTPNIIIQGGVYTAGTARRRGGGAAPFTWTPADPRQVIIDARPLPDCSGTGEAIWISGADNVTIANLTVRHSDVDNIWSTGNFTTLDTVRSLSAQWFGAYIEGYAPTVRNAYFTANYSGIVLTYGEDALIQNNTIYNHSCNGIYAYESWYATISGNTINGTAGFGFEGIFLDYCDDAIVSNNTIRGTGEEGIETYDSYYLTIADNDIRSCYHSGIFLNVTTGSVVSGNSVGGIDFHGIDVIGLGGNTISNNVVEDTYDDGIRVFDYDTTITGNLVRNIFAEDCFSVEAYGGAISNNQADGATYGDGFDLQVDDMTISNNTAQFNSYEGFDIDGDGNTISNNTARHNGDDWSPGFLIDGIGNTISGNLAEMNPGYGFYIQGNNAFTGNTAHNNYRTGIYLDSTYGGTLLVNDNLATNNHGEGIANFASGTCDIINNTALGNRTDICDEGPADLFQNNTFVTGGWNQVCCLE